VQEELLPAEARPSRSDRVLVGTSGYSFADWVGPFYPPGTPPHRFLGYYARNFDVVEVNSTYYRMPAPGMFERMAAKTPPGFRFVVKLNGAMTHEGSRDPALYREFVDALQPLKDAGKYDGLLAQFPGGFRGGADGRAHLDAMRGLLGEEPLFVEFRHDSWLAPDLAPWLRERRLGFCAVDEPKLPGLLPPVTMVTTDDAYVRFHGRNDKTWWGREAGDRYDYEYSKGELEEWLKRVRELADQAKRTYLFFNNCHAGQAARNAKLMQELLRQQQIGAGPGASDRR
jgi:uncharacterized protein YecE (DUF72 family)